MYFWQNRSNFMYSKILKQHSYSPRNQIWPKLTSKTWGISAKGFYLLFYTKAIRTLSSSSFNQYSYQFRQQPLIKVLMLLWADVSSYQLHGKLIYILLILIELRTKAALDEVEEKSSKCYCIKKQLGPFIIQLFVT